MVIPQIGTTSIVQPAAQATTIPTVQPSAQVTITTTPQPSAQAKGMLTERPSSQTGAKGPTASTSGAPTISTSQVPVQTTDMSVTFAGWTDNSPPGASIAYPKKHSTAGGVGTFDDPITFSASPDALSPGTIVYVPFLKKYFIMEDYCDACDSAWKNNRSYTVALWIGGDANSSSSAQQSCENSLTPNSKVPVEVNPPSNHSVDTRPLFTNSGGCIKL